MQKGLLFYVVSQIQLANSTLSEMVSVFEDSNVNKAIQNIRVWLYNRQMDFTDIYVNPR